MWEGAAITREVGFPGIVILFNALVTARFIGQFPGVVGIDIEFSRFIPVEYPLWIGIVVIVGCDELASGLGKPECLAAATGQGNSPPVFYRYTEYLTLSGIANSQFVGERGTEKGAR